MDYIFTFEDGSASVLVHHGIKGQKWGIRRFQNPDGTYNAAGKKRYGIGDGESYSGVNIPGVSARKNKRYESSTTVTTKSGSEIQIAKRRSKDKSSAESSYEIYDNGHKVGYAFLEDKGKEMYINWISVNNSSRGKGIASAFMDYTISTAKNGGYDYLTLEVPDDSKDARHIYEKSGFKVTNKGRQEDDFWEGLTYMRKELKD